MKARIEATRARDVAEIVIGLIKAGCVQIEIAGSLRRGCEFVSDIELVVQPRMDYSLAKQGSLFDEEIPAEGHLTSRLDSVLRDVGLLKGAIKNGPKYKQLLVDGVKVDLFIVLPPAQFGCIFTLRTGSADFSKLLVTKRWQHGALPSHLQQKQGSLWQENTQIETPTERHYFKAIGIRYIPPEKRSVWTLQKEIDRANRKQESENRGQTSGVSGQKQAIH